MPDSVWHLTYGFLFCVARNCPNFWTFSECCFRGLLTSCLIGPLSLSRQCGRHAEPGHCLQVFCSGTTLHSTVVTFSEFSFLSYILPLKTKASRSEDRRASVPRMACLTLEWLPVAAAYNSSPQNRLAVELHSPSCSTRGGAAPLRASLSANESGECLTMAAGAQAHIPSCPDQKLSATDRTIFSVVLGADLFFFTDSLCSHTV